MFLLVYLAIILTEICMSYQDSTDISELNTNNHYTVI